MPDDPGVFRVLQQPLRDFRPATRACIRLEEAGGFMLITAKLGVDVLPLAGRPYQSQEYVIDKLSGKIKTLSVRSSAKNTVSPEA